MEALAAVTKDSKWQKTGHGKDGKGKGKDGKSKDGKSRKVPKQSRRIASGAPWFRLHQVVVNCALRSMLKGVVENVAGCRVKGCYGQRAARERAKYSKGSDTPAAHQQS